MPNWAYTSYRIVGEKEEVNDLYGKIKQLENRQVFDSLKQLLNI